MLVSSLLTLDVLAAVKHLVEAQKVRTVGAPQAAAAVDDEQTSGVADVDEALHARYPRIRARAEPGHQHTANVFEFKGPILRGAYDILQPDLILGDIGITGVRKIASLADYFHRLVVPHVCSTGSTALALAATLQGIGTITNCPMVEYPYDPPLLTENQQTILKAPIRIDADGYLPIPAKPGLGVEVDLAQLTT